MGAVYLATSDMLAGKPAAVKVLAPELTRHSEGVARFRAEVYAAGKIDDPNIVQVFDAGELEGGQLYMMMEYCSSGSLAALLAKRGPLPFDLILAIACPIGSALHAAHTQARITHRDIKPANILLVQEPGGVLRAKLADFGIAKLHDEQIVGGLRTGTQKILGSPGYMAPEQCTGRGGVDGRADIYAFGSVLYEMVTGQRPYAGDSVFELITQVVTETPFPRPGQLRRDLPAGWEDVIMACLAHRREDRIQTVKQVVQQLARAIGTGPSLMSYMAPRLVDDQIAPTAITISDGIGAAVTQWADAQRAGRRRESRSRLGALTMVLCGVIVGSGATALVTCGGTSAAPQVASIASDASSDPAQRVAHGGPRIAGDPARAGFPLSDEDPPRGSVVQNTGSRAAAQPLDAGVAIPGTTTAGEAATVAWPTAPAAGAAIPRSAAPSAATSAIPRPVVPAGDPGVVGRPAVLPDAGATQRATAPPVDTSGVAHGAEAPADPGGTQRRSEAGSALAAGGDRDRPSRAMDLHSAQAPVERGALRVEVDPWADVTISGEKNAFTTPVTIPLTAGHHRVVLTKGTLKETIDVTIIPNETTRITRSW